MSSTEVVTVGPQGRVVIPAAFREALGLEPGSPLVARLEEGRIVLESRAQVVVRLRARFAKVPQGVSLADELMADRRREAARERR